MERPKSPCSPPRDPCAEGSFRFECGPGRPCAGQCCRAHVRLTPWDVLRLRRHLGMGSGDFLRECTAVALNRPRGGAGQESPSLLLALVPGPDGACLFLEEGACRAWPARPWACRVYPLGAPSGAPEPMALDEGCPGLADGTERTLREWMDSQGTEEDERWGVAFQDLLLPPPERGPLSPQQLEMALMAAYDLDRFRRFVFESSLLRRFQVDEDLAHQMGTDDEALLEFALQWLRFALLGEPTMRVRDSARAAARTR